MRIPPDLRDHVEKHKLGMNKTEHVVHKRAPLSDERNNASFDKNNIDHTNVEKRYFNYSLFL